MEKPVTLSNSTTYRIAPAGLPRQALGQAFSCPDMRVFIKCKGTDPDGWNLYQRHYTFDPSKPHWTNKFTPVGQTLVLKTPQGNVIFAWVYNTAERFDKLDGVFCTIFRNESDYLSSDLVSEACVWAWDKWPNKVLYTYINPRKIRSKNPGYCFKKAGFKQAKARSKVHNLILLYREPNHAE